MNHKAYQIECQECGCLWFPAPTDATTICNTCRSRAPLHQETPGGNPAPHVKHSDPVNHPKHYTSHPSGVECIQITEHMGFNLGNALKYIWRADLKGASIEDLRKAVWYVNREIDLRERQAEQYPAFSAAPRAVVGAR